MTSALRDEPTVATSGSHVLQIRRKLKKAKLKRDFVTVLHELPLSLLTSLALP